MKLIVGLGNPGDRYESTRHNAGFWLVERFAAQCGIALRKDAKFQALVGRHEPSGAWLLLPQNFMNASGRPVQMLASFFKIAPADILVAHDELDFPAGTVKMKQGGGAAGHNGLKDISARLGVQDYWRLRIGVGHPGDRNAVTEYVLNKPSQDDRADIDDAIGRALDVLPLVLAGDTQGAMLKLHSAPEPAAKVEKPSRAQHPGRAEKPARKEKTGEKGSAGAPAVPAGTNTPDQPEKSTGKSTEKSGSGLGSFFRKLLPDTKTDPKK
jgi:peptidyl-tRNA hydrolase, PTH1 family